MNKVKLGNKNPENHVYSEMDSEIPLVTYKMVTRKDNVLEL